MELQIYMYIKALSMEKSIHNLWKISVLEPVILQPEINHVHVPILLASTCAYFVGMYVHAVV